MESLNGPDSQFLALGEKLIEQPFGCPEAFARQNDRLSLTHRSEIKPLASRRYGNFIMMLRATASATLMPSTPAERMPPA